MADLKKMLLTMHPNTKALAKAFANNILAGFAGEGEEVDAANPYGCNQYGEGWKAPHNGRASKQGAPVKKTDKVEEELPKLIGSTKQVEWAESIRENAMWYAEISGDSPERLPLMARIRTAKWWIDHRKDAMTLEQLKEAVAEDEKAFEEELEELERRGERDRSWREYERKVRSGELKPFDPDGKLRRATDYLYSARADDDSRRRKEPIEMPDGTKCYTEGCERHEDSGVGVTAKDEIQLSTGKHLKPASYFNEEEKEAWRRIVKNPVAKELLELVADDSQEAAQSDKPVVYRKTTQEECDDIRKQAAEQNNPLPEKFNLEEYEHTINGTHITHSLKRHGHGRSGGLLKREDFALVPEIIDNPDKRTYRHKVYEDGRIERSVRYLKNFGNRSYTYVEHLLSPPTSKKSSKKRELAMVTAWLDVQKKG